MLPGGGGLRLDLTAAPLEPGALGALLGTPPAPLHELVLFGHELAAADLTWLRARAAAAPGLAVLDLRGLGGAPLDLGPLAATADGAPHHLRDLNLAGTTLADGAVDHLAALPGLERVVLWGTGLGDADLARLAEVRPDLALVGASPPSDAPLETEPEVVLERERRCLDFDHAAVGGRAALAIGLGEGLAARIARHHEPGEDPAASLLALCDAISVHAHLRPELFVEGTPEGAELEALLERCLPAAWSAQGPLRPADIARGLPALLAEARHLTERLGG